MPTRSTATSSRRGSRMRMSRPGRSTTSWRWPRTTTRSTRTTRTTRPTPFDDFDDFDDFDFDDDYFSLPRGASYDPRPNATADHIATSSEAYATAPDDLDNVDDRRRDNDDCRHHQHGLPEAATSDATTTTALPPPAWTGAVSGLGAVTCAQPLHVLTRMNSLLASVAGSGLYANAAGTWTALPSACRRHGRTARAPRADGRRHLLDRRGRRSVPEGRRRRRSSRRSAISRHAPR